MTARRLMFSESPTNMALDKQLQSEIKSDEGYSLQVYLDTEGKPTVGYGHLVTRKDNLPLDASITPEKAQEFFVADLNKAVEGAKRVIGQFAWDNHLSLERKRVLTNMVYQMGETGVSKFQQMIREIKTGDWENAAKAMLVSNWAQQTPHKAQRLAERMRKG